MTNTGKSLLVILLVAVMLVAIIIGAFRAKALEARPAPKSPGAIIVQKIVEGRSPVSKAEFDAVFHEYNTSERDVVIRWAANDLGVKIEEVRYIIGNLSVVYNGDQEKIPPKLRSTAVSP